MPVLINPGPDKSCPACGESTVMYLGDVSASKEIERVRIMLSLDNGS
ncbi:hypothetical protein [Marinomonas pollencensis]|nr:hypothetical protein [Marinomonas pollencensis]